MMLMKSFDKRMGYPYSTDVARREELANDTKVNMSSSRDELANLPRPVIWDTDSGMLVDLSRNLR